MGSADGGWRARCPAPSPARTSRAPRPSQAPATAARPALSVRGATRSPRRGRVAQLTAALAHVWMHGYRPVRRRDEGSHTVCGAAAVGSLGLGDDWEWRRRWPPTGSRSTSRRLWPWPPAKLVPATSILRRPSTRRSLTCSTSGAERRSGGAVRRLQSCFGVAQVVRQREWSGWGGSSGAASGAVQAGPSVDGEIEPGAIRYPGLATSAVRSLAGRPAPPDHCRGMVGWRTCRRPAALPLGRMPR